MGNQTLKISNVEGKDQEEQVENGDSEKANLIKEREYNLKYKKATSKVLGKIRYCIWNKNRVHSQGSITWTWMIVSGEFIISLVLSHHSKKLNWQTDRCYVSILLASKGNYILQAWGRADAKDEKRSPRSILAPLFVSSSSPWACPL